MKISRKKFQKNLLSDHCNQQYLNLTPFWGQNRHPLIGLTNH